MNKKQGFLIVITFLITLLAFNLAHADSLETIFVDGIINSLQPQASSVNNSFINGSVQFNMTVLGANTSIGMGANITNITLIFTRIQDNRIFLSSDAVGDNTDTLNISSLTNITFDTTSIPDGQYNLTVNITNVTLTSTLNTSITNITIDNVAPAINFVDATPVNNTFQTAADSILVNVTLNDTTVYNVTFTFANSTTVNTTTFTNPFNSTTGFLNDAVALRNISYNFSLLETSTNQTWTYNVTVFDQYGRSNTSLTRTLTVDGVNPLLAYVVNTEANGSTKSQDFILVNVTITDTNLANITFTFGNSTTVNSTSYTTTNSTFTFNFTGSLGNDTYLYNVSVTDSANNINTTPTRVIILDSLVPSPEFLLNTEANGTVSNQNFILINVSANDNNVANYTFTFGNSTTVNSTTIVSTNQTMTFNFSITGLGNDTYIYNVSVVTDSANNQNTTETRVLIIDNVLPVPSFTDTTEANGTSKSQNFILVNVTTIETNMANITFTFGNSTTVNSTSYTTTNSTFTFNFTGVGNDTYFYNVSVRDSANNVNTTVTRTITLDARAPNPSFISNTLANGTSINQNFILLNLSIIDANVANVTFRFANSTTVNSTTLVITNNTLTYNFTGLNDANEIYLYNITIRDTANNVNTSETRVITLTNSSLPSISFVLPTDANNTFVDRLYIPVNVSVGIVSTEANITFTFGNSTMVNSTTFSTAVRIYNFTAINVDSVYTYNVTVIDTSNNQNTSLTRTITFDSINPTPSLTSSLGASFTEGGKTSLTCSSSDVNTDNLTLKQGSTVLCTGTNICNAEITPAVGTVSLSCQAFDQAANTATAALTLTVSSTSGSGSSSSGGGGGGGGGSVTYGSLSSDETVSYTFSDTASTGVEKVEFSTSRNIDKSAKITLNTLQQSQIKDLPENMELYRAFSLETDEFDDNDLDHAKITYGVSEIWLEHNNREANQVILLRKEGESWKTYQSRPLELDGGIFFFESIVPGFSDFVIALNIPLESTNQDALSLPGEETEAIPENEGDNSLTDLAVSSSDDFPSIKRALLITLSLLVFAFLVIGALLIYRKKFRKV